MKCRKISNGTVVWFGSIGKNQDGTAIFENEQHSSYAENKDGLASLITQSLSVIKGELWYNISYGLPLFDKINSKAQIDMYIARIISSHQDVLSILSFDSSLIQHNYSCKFVVKTKYGDISLSI